ncbi:hypothetical protein B0H14DRAFT_3453072 [Mycena olivaceomarginata]|nr:hypothetical protein B0H14DRAFT_3453072 [Mycena olivaceomarginata]
MAVNAKPAKMNVPCPIPPPQTKAHPPEPLEWDWDIEHADRARERQADAALHGATPFEVDRRVLKDVVLEHMKTPVARIVFMSAGTFHKAYLITLTSSHQVVARVARRFMPRLKTESEVATLRYLRENTRVPVGFVEWHGLRRVSDWIGRVWMANRLAATLRVWRGLQTSLAWAAPGNSSRREEISPSSMGTGTPLSQACHPALRAPLPANWSLYLGPDPTAPSPPSHSNAPTPTLTRASTLTMSSLSTAFSALADTPRASQKQETYGSFPFTPALTPRAPPFPSTMSGPSSPGRSSAPSVATSPPRPSAASPEYVPRGPFPATPAYFAGCVEREVLAVQRENAGSAAGHRLHLDPAEILSSRHHRVVGVEGDESDDSDRVGAGGERGRVGGPGGRDVSRLSTGAKGGVFGGAYTEEGGESVRREFGEVDARGGAVERRVARGGGEGGAEEEFALDAHDLSLENVFVDPADPTVITCVIDWESTTTRPLWAAAHLPAFLQSSPFTAKLFREAVLRLADPTAVAGKTGTHRPALAPDANDADAKTVARLAREWLHHERTGMRLRMAHRVVEWDGWEEGLAKAKGGTTTGKPAGGKLFAKNLEREKEQMLDTTGDICGGAVASWGGDSRPG